MITLCKVAIQPCSVQLLKSANSGNLQTHYHCLPTTNNPLPHLILHQYYFVSPCTNSILIPYNTGFQKTTCEHHDYIAWECTQMNNKLLTAPCQLFYCSDPPGYACFLQQRFPQLDYNVGRLFERLHMVQKNKRNRVQGCSSPTPTPRSQERAQHGSR